MRTIWIAAVLTMLSACGPSGNSAPAGNEVAGGDVGQRLRAMPEGQRNAVLIRAIRDAQLDCQHVRGSVPAGDYRGLPVWEVHCAGGGQWTLVVTGDGTAQILDANEARLVRDGNQQ